MHDEADPKGRLAAHASGLVPKNSTNKISSCAQELIFLLRSVLVEQDMNHHHPFLGTLFESFASFSWSLKLGVLEVLGVLGPSSGRRFGICSVDCDWSERPSSPNPVPHSEQLRARGDARRHRIFDTPPEPDTVVDRAWDGDPLWTFIIMCCLSMPDDGHILNCCSVRDIISAS
jgi:hypothetical protein